VNTTVNKPPATLVLPPLGLYVHIPWCIKKCPYCDFNSHVSSDAIPETAYVDALIKDLKQQLGWVQGRKLHSIFFGGGTPSLFSGRAISRIIEAAERLIGFCNAIEITLEANPGSAEQARFNDYRKAGVNRLSIGIQSFGDQHLERLGRVHDGHQAQRAIEAATMANFARINIDLMHGLEQQSSAQAINDLRTAIDAGVEHISWYQLTIEPNTAFFSQPPPLPSDDRLADIQTSGMNLLAEHGFQQYEVSAFAKADQLARHNVNYWEFGDYLGIGAGAHGKITMAAEKTLIRSQKTRQPTQYLAQKQDAENRYKVIPLVDRPMEFMMNALRLKNGVPIDYFAARTGLGSDNIAKPLRQLQSQGLLVTDPERIAASPLGYQFLNTLLQRFA